MPRLQAVFYRAPDGSQPVDEFIEALKPPAKQAAIDNQVDRLNTLTSANPHLPFPHSSQVRGDLRELRCHFGSELYRILYRRSRNLIILLHMFRKTPARSPNARSRSPRHGGTTSRRGWKRRSPGLRVQWVATPLDELTKIDKLPLVSPRQSNASPAGTTASEARRRRARRSPEYRAAQERLAPYEAIARFVIRRRAALGLTQEQLADRMGTSHSAISRIESGQHRTSVATLERLAGALEVRFVLGFETGPPDAPVRELVSV